MKKAIYTTAALGFCSAAMAATIVVPDASFEDQDTNVLAPVDSSVSGWSASGGGQGIFDDGDLDPNFQFPARTGDRLLYLDTSNNAFTDGNDIGTNAVAGFEYTLAVDFLDRFNGSEGAARGYRVELLAGSALSPITIADTGNQIYDFDGAEQSFEISTNGIAAPGADGQPLWIRLSTHNDTGITATEVFYDNVRLSAVPEPSSAALLGLGGLALILRRRQ